VLARIADAPLSAERVLAGIEAALDAGLAPVKVNMVVRRGYNEQCVVEMAERFRHTPVVLRFIEYMDVGSSNGWQPEDVVAGEEIVGQLQARWPLEPLAPSAPGEVASRYRYRDGAGEVGVIHSVSEPFCGGCTRARLSAEGVLYTCLFARGGHDLRALLREGAGEQEIERRLREVWGDRVDRYSVERASAAEPASAPAKVEMSYIGG
jgi:GTP 3',8-cyclase